MKLLRVRVGGRRYEIPDIWLWGKSQTDIAAGVPIMEAYRRAILWWDEQARLAESVDARGRAV